MRNLKKVLSLALALVMLLGMMMVGAGAADTAAADIAENHKEAATVLNAVKVVEGDGSGKIDGKGNLSRADATILVVRIKYGTDVEKLLRANPVDTGFNDVSRNHYASGVIAHCVAQDIVHGINATTFDPNGNITGIDFATLVMQALGIEGDYGSGSGRASKVLVALRENGLDNEVVVTTAPITRETAFQLMFNAITEYSPSGSKGYYVGDNTGVIYDSLTDAMLAVMASGGKLTAADIHEAPAADTLAKTMFNLAKVTTTSYGRSGYTWQVNGKDVTEFVGTDKVLGTSTNGTSLTNLSSKTHAKFIAEADSGVKYYNNGVEDKSSGHTATDAAVAKKGVTVELVDKNGNGKYDVVITTEKKVGVVGAAGVTINEATSAGKVDGVTVALAVGGSDLTGKEASKVHGYEGLEKDDVILYWTMGTGAATQYYIEKLEPVVGTLTGKKGADYMLNSGDAYGLSGLTNAPTNDTPFTGLYGKEVNLYLDDNGTIVKVSSTEPAAAPDYAVVYDIVWVGGAVSAGTTTGGHVEALLVKLDGTTEVKEITSIDGYRPAKAGEQIVKLGPNSGDNSIVSYVTGNNKVAAEGTTSTAVGTDTVTAGNYLCTYHDNAGTVTLTNALGKYVGIQSDNNGVTGGAWEGKFYSFVENPMDSKKVSLTSIAAATSSTAGTITIDSGAAYKTGETTIGNSNKANVNEKTIFIVKTEDKGVVSFKAYTGIKEMPSLTSTMSGVAVANKLTANGGFASYVYVSGTLDDAAANKEYAYITNTTAAYTIPQIGTSAGYRIYNAIVNGEVTTINVAEDQASSITAVGLYEITRNKDGLVTAVTKQDNSSGNVAAANLLQQVAGIKAAKNGVVGLAESSTKYYTYTEETKVFRILTDGTIQKGDVSSIVEDTDDKVDAVVEKLGSSAVGSQATTLKTVYVKQVNEDSTGGVAPGVGEPTPPGPATTPISGENVTYNEADASTLNSNDTLKALTPGMYTFKNMPAHIKDAGTDASKLVLFRWQNTAAGNKKANIEIMNSAGTVIWNGWTDSLASGAHYSYILIQKPGGDKLWTADDNGLFIANGDYTWRITLEDGTAPVAQGSFNVKW